MPTIEELETQLAQAIRERDALQRQLDRQCVRINQQCERLMEGLDRLRTLILTWKSYH